MHGTSSATIGKNYCRMDNGCFTSFASFSLLLILLDMECGGEENAKATDKQRLSVTNQRTGDFINYSWSNVFQK